MSAALRVAVVAGGPSAEAEVSRTSARAVCAALERAGHIAEQIELDARLPAHLDPSRHDVVFPAVHGPVGEDGCLQGLLEVMGFPYVGSGVLASALAMNKALAKVHLERANLPVAPHLKISGSEDLDEAAGRIRAELGVRVVVKPVVGGSAIGVTPIESTLAEGVVARALRTALTVGTEVLAERMVSGKEITCGVLEDDEGTPTALPPTLIEPVAAGWYDFTAKYAAGGSAHTCPAPLHPEVLERVRSLAVQTHTALGARDLSRTDFIVNTETGEVVVLELNTLPGMTATSLFPEAAQVAGISFIDLCSRLVRKAAARPRRTSPQALAMP